MYLSLPVINKSKVYYFLPSEIDKSGRKRMPGDDEDVGNGQCETLTGMIISCFNLLK